MKQFLFTVLAVAFAFHVSAQKYLVIDLANFDPDQETVKQTIAAGEYSEVILLNRSIADGVSYAVSTEMNYVESTPFELPTRTQNSILLTDTNTRENEACNEIIMLSYNLKFELDEKLIPEKIGKLQSEIEKLEAGKCTANIELAEEFIKKASIDTIEFIQTLELSKSAELMLTIRSGTKTWKFQFSTPSGNNWRLFFGFTYVMNQMTPVDQYYASETNSGSYEITKMHGGRSSYLENITPTLMFTYKPRVTYSSTKDHPKYEYAPLKAALFNNFYKVGFTGGISLDLTNPTAMVGPSIIIKDNLSLNFGVVFSQKDVLRGKYQEGQIYTENKDFDDLHEKQYMADWFFSIAFRFSSNPFKSGDDSTSPSLATY
jgi:hypothetical protein